jgi:hypothetical protein
MTSQQKSSRSDIVRQRRASRIPNPQSAAAGKQGQAGSRQTSRTSRQAYRPESIFLPVEPRPIAPTTLRQMKDGTFRPVQGSTFRKTIGLGTPARAKSRMVKNPHRKSSRTKGKGYEFAFSLGHTAVRAPLLNLPNLGSRWISAGLTLLLGLLLFTMGTANTFKVTTVELIGNQRLDTADVRASLGLIGQPIYKAIPSKIADDLREAFPDLASVSVRVGLPNDLQITMVERTPVLVWQQEGETRWIDTNGIAFPQRGEVPNLVQVISNGSPAKPPLEQQNDIFEDHFIEPDLVQAILTLYPQVPSGAPMVFDPKYGMGWKDPQGWSVYFGQNTQNIETKKRVYQAILDTFSQQGIQPTLVSVAYLDAPFYK